MPDHPTTSVLLIDANDTDRIRFATYLNNCASGYTIFEAIDGQSGLDLYRSRQIDCVVLSLDLPDQSGFRVLVDLVPFASKPSMAVVTLTDRTTRGVHEIAMQNGAYACFIRQFTSGDDLERAILRAMAFVGRMPKEDRGLAHAFISAPCSRGDGVKRTGDASEESVDHATATAASQQLPPTCSPTRSTHETA